MRTQILEGTCNHHMAGGNVIYNNLALSSFIGFLKQQSPREETAAFMC